MSRAFCLAFGSPFLPANLRRKPIIQIQNPGFGRLRIKTQGYVAPKTKSFHLKRFLNSQAPYSASLGSAKLWLNALRGTLKIPAFQVPSECTGQAKSPGQPTAHLVHHLHRLSDGNTVPASSKNCTCPVTGLKGSFWGTTWCLSHGHPGC